MKFIGQHIYDFVARFRNNVYLEDVPTGTIASGGNLGLDSNNKIVKATAASGDIEGVTAGTGLSGGGTTGTVTLNVSGLTVSEIAAGSILVAGETFVDNDTSLMSAAAINDRIESFGYTTNTGDITSVSITTDSGGGDKAEDASGSAEFSILGATGVGITNSGTTITATAVPGEIDHDSLLNFAANEHFTQANITTVGTLDTGNATAIVDAASLTAAGKVELATTGEADTGTDTTRAVTPAGLKSHVDAYARKCILRAIQFYINDAPMVQNNLYFGGNIGHQPNNWNDPAPVGGVIGDTASFTIAGDDENWGIVLPFNISKVEVQCSLRPNLGTGDDITVAIYTGIRTTDADANLTLTKVAHNSVSHSGTNNRYTRNDVSVTGDYDKNTLIYVGVGSEDNTDMKNGRGYMTITVTER